jgi:hypothetical protein
MLFRNNMGLLPDNMGLLKNKSTLLFYTNYLGLG